MREAQRAERVRERIRQEAAKRDEAKRREQYHDEWRRQFHGFRRAASPVRQPESPDLHEKQWERFEKLQQRGGAEIKECDIPFPSKRDILAVKENNEMFKKFALRWEIYVRCMGDVWEIYGRCVGDVAKRKANY